jgi:hypothetical protein
MPGELPAEPLQCRKTAEANLEEPDSAPLRAVAWALLAVAGELAEVRRELKRRGR